ALRFAAGEELEVARRLLARTAAPAAPAAVPGWRRLLAALRPYHARRRLRLGRQRRRWRRALEEHNRRRPGRDRVLLHAVSSSMLRFLEPLAEALGEEASYYLGVDEELLPAALGHGRRVLCGRPSGPRPRTVDDVLRRFDDHLRSLRALRPAAVVSAEGTHFEIELLSRACRAADVPMLCLQHGFHLVYEVLLPMDFDAMLLWGEGFRPMYAPFGPRTRFAVTGNPTLQPERLRALPPPAERRAVAFFLQYPNSSFPDGTYEAFVGLIRDVAAGAPERPVIVRPHPSFALPAAQGRRLAELANVAVMPPAEAPLAAVLAQSAVAVSISSTALLEAIAYDAVPVAIDLTKFERFELAYFALEESGAGIEARTLDEGRERLGRLLAEPSRLASFRPGLARLRRRFLNLPGPDPVARVVAEIRRQMEDGG
ncbi:MAG: hypothetical protein D6696_21415, partial [Acidobacteria bacterium]